MPRLIASPVSTVRQPRVDGGERLVDQVVRGRQPIEAGPVEEVPQQPPPARGEHAFGMELHAEDRPLAMLHRHRMRRLSVVGQRRGHRKIARHVGRHERVIARHGQCGRQPREQRRPVVPDERRSPMLRLPARFDAAAAGIDDRLMPEAHPEDRLVERADDVAADARLGRPARAGREQHRGRIGQVGQPDGVVADDPRRGPQLAAVPSERVHERVVVVDEDEHGERL